jgi:hypothetical protein
MVDALVGTEFWGQRKVRRDIPEEDWGSVFGEVVDWRRLFEHPSGPGCVKLLRDYLEELLECRVRIGRPGNNRADEVRIVG